MPLPPLEPLEVHSGIVMGERRTPPPSDPAPLTGTPREVLEALLVEPLSNPPCHVAFSGGRDSSAILAVATHVARAHALADPIPLTARLEDHPRTWEDDWQELTVRHLGLAEWDRFPVTTELGALGAIARPALLRHGVYWPSQAHSMLLFSRQAGSGSLVTGGGGDEVITSWNGRRPPLWDLVRARPRRAAAKWIAFTALPDTWQVRLVHARRPLRVPWLRPEVERRVANARRDRDLHGGIETWEQSLEAMLNSRYLELVRVTLDCFAAECGVQLHEPFYDPRFVRAMAADAPVDGYLSRSHALQRHFGDLLPVEVLRRGTKATFTEVAWGPEAREFAASWDGRGVDEAFVDPDRLREEWAKPRPSALSLGCLQQAWLGAQARA
jgi:asparagine synthetase B (glutamine-hydrolysing)